MDFSNSQDAIIALLGTIFGGAGLEVVRRALAKSKEREDTATAFRDELRDELTKLKSEMATVEKELDLWRQKFYELYEKYVYVKVQYDSVVKQLADSHITVKEVSLPATPLEKMPDPRLDTGPVAPVESPTTTTDGKES